MDDFVESTLRDSKNEWVIRLMNVLTPSIIKGLKTLYIESCRLCDENDEPDKYLITFQTFLTRVPKWNDTMIESEKKNIIETSGCYYIEDLISCVHIIQLKSLTCVRVGKEQKKIDIDIPNLNSFIHKVYINVARKVYTNIYLFEKDIEPLSIQKNNRELELIIRECILNTVRDTMPVEDILKRYIGEIVEESVVEEEEKPVKEELQTKIELPTSELAKIELPTSENKNETIHFNNIDYAISDDGIIEDIVAPKTIERLEEISRINNQEDSDDDSIKIYNDAETLDIEELNIDVIA